MSTTPIFVCSTLDFGLLDNHGNPGGIGIVFLYMPGADNLNFLLCEIFVRLNSEIAMLIQYFLRCGGTLVASNYVISAAHCFFDETCDCDEKGENCVNCIVTSQITETGFSVIIGDHDKVRFHFKNWEVSHLWEGPPQKVGFFILT